MFDIVNQNADPPAAPESASPASSPDALPGPLTPPDCDLRDFPFMPLDVRRLRDSDLVGNVTGDAFRCAVLLWAAAWHQVPAGSLPDDDAVLASLAGYGRDVAAFRIDRAAGGLHRFIRCNDGRLYHPVVAEKANEAWNRKLFQRERGRRGNAIRWGSPKDKAPIAEASFKDRGSILEGLRKDSSKDRKRQGQGQYSGAAASVSAGSATNTPSPKRRSELTDNLARSSFDTFYREYPRKQAPRKAAAAYVAAVRRGATPEAILAGLRRAKFSTDAKFIPHPATWLNDDRWLDEPPAEAAPNISVVRGAL